MSVLNGSKFYFGAYCLLLNVIITAILNFIRNKDKAFYLLLFFAILKLSKINRITTCQIYQVYEK